NSLNDFLVAIAGCLRPVVVLHIQCLREINELLRNTLYELSWSNAGFRRGLLDLLAMLIHASQKKHIVTCEPMIPCNHFGQHHFVSVPDMRRRGGVINGCSDEKRLRHFAIISVAAVYDCRKLRR